MSLDVQAVVARDGFVLDAALTVDDGETVAVVGPNGAGKTTLLRVIAGLVGLDGGRVVVDGEVVADAAAGFTLPVPQRRVGLVPQDLALFPHLTALGNVAFGATGGRRQGRGARAEATSLLDRFGVAHRAGARPAALSGGEAQRVALARALAARPRVLLLDEPLAALDASARPRTRAELRRLLSDAGPLARVLVTHDPADAMVMADRVVVLEAGRVVQDATPGDLARHPGSDYVAALVGVNLLRGRIRGGRLVLDSGAEVVAGATPGLGDVADGDPAVASFHPHAVALHPERPSGTPRNVWAGTVAGIEQLPGRARVEVAGAVPVVAEVTGAAVDALGLESGGRVWVSVKATEVTLSPT